MLGAAGEVGIGQTMMHAHNFLIYIAGFET